MDRSSTGALRIGKDTPPVTAGRGIASITHIGNLTGEDLIPTREIDRAGRGWFIEDITTKVIVTVRKCHPEQRALQRAKEMIGAAAARDEGDAERQS